jgi:ribonuclease-3
MTQILIKLEKALQTKFNNKTLLQTALTHRSYLNEHKKVEESNERLEFLGDAVLELIVSQQLFTQYPDYSEGKLTNLRSKIVQTKTLASIAKKLALADYILLSKGEKEGGGNKNDSLLADTLEAVIGAIFLDKGMDTALEFIKKNLLVDLDLIISNEDVTDYKSNFQEIVQSKGYQTPSYQILKSFGPDHDKTFVSAVFVDNKEISQGTGKSKQEAQQSAAKVAIEKWGKLK